MKPYLIATDSALADIFKQMPKLEGSKGPENCVVFACHRHEHVPVLHVRPARYEYANICILERHKIW